MIAHWKSMVFASIGFVSLAWLGPGGDSRGTLTSPTELAMPDTAFDQNCAARHSPRCLLDIRYAYPAADLYVVAPEVYF